MTFEQVCTAAEYVRGKLSTQPKVGIILGSGLGGIADESGYNSYGYFNLDGERK